MVPYVANEIWWLGTLRWEVILDYPGGSILITQAVKSREPLPTVVRERDVMMEVGSETREAAGLADRRREPEAKRHSSF